MIKEEMEKEGEEDREGKVEGGGSMKEEEEKENEKEQ